MGPIVINPLNGKLHVQSGGVSKQVNPTTFAVTSTALGTVLAADQHKSKLFATSGNNLQIINAASNKIEYTIPLGYTPGSQIAVNNALRHIYLLNPAANKVEVRGITAISSATDVRGQFVATFSLGTGNMPVGVAADAIRGRAYVVVNNSGSYSLWAIEDTTSVKQCDYVNKGNGNGE
jgi:DNA-binding beta-propeller fold protein YncE